MTAQGQTDRQRTIMLVLVALILVLSLVQTFQIADLKEEGLSVGGETSAARASSSQSLAAAGSGQRAPAMVGGC